MSLIVSPTPGRGSLLFVGPLKERSSDQNVMNYASCQPGFSSVTYIGSSRVDIKNKK